jgi:hypothetical protein
MAPAATDALLNALLDALADRVAERLRDVPTRCAPAPSLYVTVAHEATCRGLTPRELRATCRAHGVPVRQDGPRAWVAPGELDRALECLPCAEDAATRSPKKDELDEQVSLSLARGRTRIR